MKKFTRLVLALFVLFGAGQASAKTLGWHGTLDIDVGALPEVTFKGSGVATVNNSGGGSHLNTLRLAGGITGSGTIPVTDPDTTGTIPSYQLTVTLGTGTLSGISGAPPLNPPATLPVPGVTRVCLFAPGICNPSISVPLTLNSGATGLGVGGLLTMGNKGLVRISIQVAPWTVGTVSGINQTKDGGLTTITRVGFVHGAASNNSSTATGSGVIQLIAA
jgi:hypothetical protein